MKHFVRDNITHFVSDELLNEFERDRDHLMEYTRTAMGDEFSDGGVFWKAICHFKKTSFPRIAILHAHGVDTDGIWMYCDGKEKPIQGWINRNDAKYDCLILFSCNPGASTPTSKKALLVVPDGIIQMLDDRCFPGDYNFTLIHPKHGEIDDYVVDYYLQGGESGDRERQAVLGA